ncbi:MAG: FAD-dependent thymidylate synthase [Candidatus Sericytochromatia bacterium]|nr:FAD-dependent thymidylate synthase [Candidatus Tanganyikabacteria bacterium]
MSGPVDAPALKQGGRVVVLPPLPPERQAYALARYSRSADPIEASLTWVHAHSAERFWEKFYFDYGHASIADLGHLAICLEGLSDLAAAEVLHDGLIDAQARSTRYQDFSRVPLVCPAEDPAVREAVRSAGERLRAAYLEVFEAERVALERQHPRPEGMPPDVYGRNLAARAFDVARYLLPVAASTGVGLVLSVRTLERLIGRLAASPLLECRQLAESLAKACREAPDDTWSRLTGEAVSAEPLAPTLARHAHPHAWAAGVRERSAARATADADALDRALDACVAPSIPRGLPGDAAAWREHGLAVAAGAAGEIDLLPPHEADEEALASLLYAAVPGRSYRQVLAWARSQGPVRRANLLTELLAGRGSHDDWPRELRVGHRYVAELTLDWGSFRDMHRHRRGEHLVPPLDLDAGACMPVHVADPDNIGRIRRAAGRAAEEARAIDRVAPGMGVYALPFAQRTRTLFRMDWAQAQYIVQLRTGLKGHDAYRAVSHALGVAIAAAEPGLAGFMRWTDPAEREPLVR